MRISFYFDYACPWAYFGSCRVESYFADLGVEIDFRPVHLATLKEPAAGELPPWGPRKKTAYLDDLRYWSEMVGGDLSKDAGGLVKASTRLALCGALVAQDEGRFRAYHYRTYRARWAEARDLSQPEVVRELLAGAGLDGDAALAHAQSKELDERVEQETQQAIERGVFGVPTIFVGDRMFWGNDRFELVRFNIQKAGG
jgi:2-hydroxychromene-2-carboxylate isomerase